MPSAKACGRALLAAYPNLQVLAVTMGPHGSLLLTRDQAEYHRGFPIAVKDTVGAGDAFTAGFVHAWMAGASLRAVNQVGNLCGSFVASQEGATPVFPAALLEKVAVALHEAEQRHARAVRAGAAISSGTTNKSSKGVGCVALLCLVRPRG